MLNPIERFKVAILHMKKASNRLKGSGTKFGNGGPIPDFQQ